MNYRPYIWMGDDQDAHVQAYRNIEVAKAVESGYGYVYGARAKFMLIKPSQITMRADPKPNAHRYNNLVARLGPVLNARRSR
jgi:hypothetical protein